MGALGPQYLLLGYMDPLENNGIGQVCKSLQGWTLMCLLGSGPGNSGAGPKP